MSVSHCHVRTEPRVRMVSMTTRVSAPQDMMAGTVITTLTTVPRVHVNTVASVLTVWTCSPATAPTLATLVTTARRILTSVPWHRVNITPPVRTWSMTSDATAGMGTGEQFNNFIYHSYNLSNKKWDRLNYLWLPINKSFHNCEIFMKEFCLSHVCLIAIIVYSLK